MLESNATVNAVLSKSLFLLRAMIANPFESSVGEVGGYEVLSAGTKRNPFLVEAAFRFTSVSFGLLPSMGLPIRHRTSR